MLIETAYLPPVSWMMLAYQAEELVIEAHENYQKGSWRNRCTILGPNGIQPLSVPLRKGKNQKQLIRDVEIAYEEPWQQVHWRSIQAAYGNSPYFEHFSHEIEPFYHKKHRFLFDLNLELIQWITSTLGWDKSIELSARYTEDRPENDYRNMLSPKKNLPDSLPMHPYPQVFSETLWVQAQSFCA